MAPRQHSDTGTRNGDISTTEIVFSCGVCQKLISDVYATKESDHGFNSSDHDESGVVVKFWMADCSHTFCGKHLEGGGAPFHREGQQPSALCPVCTLISPTRTMLRELFDVRGLQDGEYAAEIPALYLKCPPGDLSGVSPGMDAYRFQYSQMVRYSKAVTSHWRSEQRKRRILESSFSKERKDWRKQEADIKDRIAALEKAEAKLKKWEQRREMINHYLGLVGKMGEDINRMRSQLAHVGLHVPDGHYAFEASKSDAHNEHEQRAYAQSEIRGDSAATLVGDQHHRSSSSRKRRQSVHEEFGDDKENRRNSRELMPPPLPRPRQPPQQLTQASAPGYVLRGTSQRSVASTAVDHSRGMHGTTRLGALPFRPSQRPSPIPRTLAREERIEPYYVDDVDARYQLPAISASTPAAVRPFAPFTTQQVPAALQRSNLQPSAASVASPFFHSDAAMRTNAMQRPPARGAMAPPLLPHRADVPRSSIGGYSVPPSRSSVIPSRSASLAQRHRMELGPHPPPSSSRVPMGSSFDPQLSALRGVRGTNASQMTYSRQGYSSSQPPPRTTYSAASGRRSVLR